MDPTGDHNEDTKRREENLAELTELAWEIVEKLADVAENKDSKEASVAALGADASIALSDIRDFLNEDE